jgi:hypothetical protein
MAADAWYPLEKLYVAVRALATGRDRLPQRLRAAWLAMHPARGKFPSQEFEDRFRDIADWFFFDREEQRHAFEALEAEEQERVAAQILDLFVDLEKQWGAPPSRPGPE